MGKSFGVRGKKATNKVHNSTGSILDKIEIRLNVLGMMPKSNVLDVYCGPIGEMWSSVWVKADSYIGCDLEWDIKDPRPRFVGDSLRILRSLDLSKYNIFDVDAFGSPWEVMQIILSKRTWQAGELGAVALTDGTSMNTRWGAIPLAMAELVGVGAGRLAPTGLSADALQAMALRSWCKLANVKPLQMWQAHGTSSGGGTLTMAYTGIVFEGL